MTDKVAVIAPARLDPQALIAKAIEKDVDVGILERLVELAKDVRRVTAREAFFEAMAEFKKKCPPITKDAVANTGRYSYKYATLNSILEAVQPILTDQGLTVSWRQKHEGQAVHASAVITHRQGHQEESGFIAMPFDAAGQMNPAQRVGSAATYAKRYSLLAVLGIAPEDDDDAQSTTGSRPTGDVRASGQKEEPRTGASSHPDLTPSGAPSGTLDAVPGVARQPDEAEINFPDPQEDVERERLLNEARRLRKKIKMSDKETSDFWATYVGKDVTPSNADPAALTDMVKALKTRAGE